MSGEQQTPEAESSPAFGEILINPQAGTAGKKEEEKSVPPPKPKKRRAQGNKRTSKSKEPKKKAGSKKKLLICSLVLIVLPVLLFLAYLAAATYLLPSYIQNQLAAQYGQQLNRPVTIGQAEFNPFTFDLHLADIYIGPELTPQGKNEPALCRIATFDTRIRPDALLQGKILLEESNINKLQAEVVRRADGSFTGPGLEGQNAPLLPSWLKLDGLGLAESTLILRDASTDHEYRLDEITFSLPSAATGATNKQDAAIPTLHAMVNGNPVQIQGERLIDPDKGPLTRLTLQLDDIDPQQILAWLPSMNDALHITSKNTTARLELILTDNPQDEEELALSGTISFTDLDMKSSPQQRNGQKDVFQCTSPSAKLIIQANPFRKQYRINELILNDPQLSLPESKGSLDDQPLSNWPGQIFKPALLPIDLQINRLSINNGTVHRGKQRGTTHWDALQLELTGYQNRARAEKAQENEPAVLSFSAQQGTSTVRFKGTTTPALDLIGEISLQNLDAGLLQPYLGNGQTQNKNQVLQLTAGKVDLIMQANPVEKQYIVRELTLEQPQLLLAQADQNKTGASSSDQLPLSHHLGQLFQPSLLPFDLSVERFIINKGSLKKQQGQSWQDLHVKLVDYHNRTSSSAPLSFTARQGKMTVRFQGSTAADLSLNGKIFLGNLSVNQLQAYLGSQHGLRLSGGKAEVSGLLQTEQTGRKKHSILIKEARVTTQHINIQREKQESPLLTAGSAAAEQCTLHITQKRLSCADLSLEQADFSSAAPAFFLSPEEPELFSALSFNTITIKDSKARLPIGSYQENLPNSLMLPLTRLNMEIKDLQAASSEQANLRLLANLGANANANAHGKVKVEGFFHQAKGKLDLTVENLSIKALEQPFAALFRKKSAPGLKQGDLSFQGQVQLPELNFQGNVQLSNLVAENRQGVHLRWKNARGNEVLGGMQPFYMHIKDLVVQEPELQLGSSKAELPGALLSLFRKEENKLVLPPFTIKQCRIQGGSLLPDTSTGKNYTAVQGQLAPLASGTPASFTFSGKVNTRKFTAQGQLQQTGAEVDSFTVAELSLDSTTQQFKELLSLEQPGKIRWIPSAERNDQGQVHFSDFRPQQDSEYALLLGLLTNKNDAFSIPLALPATASPAEIGKKAKARIQRLHLQTVVSPHTVLEKEFPDLTLPQRINFIVGDSLPDFMDDLENFAALLDRRPYLRLQLRGCYDDTADRKYLRGLLQEEEDYRIDLENIRRQEEMARLLAEEELRQVELVNTDSPIGENLIPVIEAREDLQPLPHQPIDLPQKILPELARQRALVVQKYLKHTLGLPADKIILEKPCAGGPWVDLLIGPDWQQPAKTTEVSEQQNNQ
uniref:DUF748 domain-containing protein n=1 Tax=Candidatus Electrothrix sp. TaxID=2170559 RepID=UPI004056B7A1